MTRPLWILLSMVLLLGMQVMAWPVWAASFDCNKAKTKVEKLICRHADLSMLDDELGKHYQKLLVVSNDKTKVIKSERHWLRKTRNQCQTHACLHQVYVKRIRTLKTLLKFTYHFILTRGKGVPVCKAYLKRLNATTFSAPPFCGRPENDSIPGFTLLHRVPLSPAEVHDLYPIVWAFMGLANRKSIDWDDMSYQHQLTQTGQFLLTKMDAEDLQREIDAGHAKIWRYDPPIDIDNDGKPDDVEVWEGIALPTGTGGMHCGEDDPRFGEELRQPQVPFVITDHHNRLDVRKTEAIFGSPVGGYPITLNGKRMMADGYRPIGDSIGIFEYRGTYYFDTFFDGWGDFEGKRRKDKHIKDTLAVFLHQHGRTRQVCEYRMTKNE